MVLIGCVAWTFFWLVDYVEVVEDVLDDGADDALCHEYCGD